jgi:hypothetical protein
MQPVLPCRSPENVAPGIGFSPDKMLLNGASQEVLERQVANEPWS